MRRSSAILLLTLGSAVVLADDFDYTFVDAGYVRTDIDADDGDGFALSGSYGVTENWHVFVGYQTAGFDFDIDLDGWNAGIGFNTPISDAIDVVADVSYVYAEVDTPFGSADEDGLGIGVGLRAHASDSVELNAGINYVDVGSDSETSLDAGALFNVNERFAVRLAASWDDDVNTYFLGGRLYF